MNTLVIFQFETGDVDPKYWNMSVIINGTFGDIEFGNLVDAMSSFLENTQIEYEFEGIVTIVMKHSGLVWHIVEDRIPECVGVWTMQI